MRVLVTGVAGQLGHDVVARLTQLSIENRGVDAADFDLTDASAVSDAILSYAPDCVVHCAAFTNVGPLLSDQHQVFGYMDGFVTLDDGSKLELRHFLCFAEKVHNKW